MNGQLHIPGAIQKLLPFKQGEMVAVYEQGNTIIIEASLEESNHNLCVYQYGKITIPAEIRKLQNITRDSLLTMEFSREGKMLLLRKMSA